MLQCFFFHVLASVLVRVAVAAGTVALFDVTAAFFAAFLVAVLVLFCVVARVVVLVVLVCGNVVGEGHHGGL